MSEKALYRKINDGTVASSTYHKKDGTNVRAILKEELSKLVDNTSDFGDSNIGRLAESGLSRRNVSVYSE